jgi:two-component system phosphate regulon response regulator OmpR
MDPAMVDQVRRFNRTVTQRIGALSDRFLSRDRPLGQARLLWEIGAAGRDLRELRARLKSVLRRVEAKAPPSARPAARERISIGKCQLDLRSHELRDARGREVPITSMEFDLLKVFVEHPNQVLSRDRLLNLTRNREWEPFDRSIDIRIARLRRKLEDDPDRPRAIRTVRGAGYMYVPSEGL